MSKSVGFRFQSPIIRSKLTTKLIDDPNICTKIPLILAPSDLQSVQNRREVQMRSEYLSGSSGSDIRFTNRTMHIYGAFVKALRTIYKLKDPVILDEKSPRCFNQELGNMSALIRSLRRFEKNLTRSLKTHALQISEERSLCYRQIPGTKKALRHWVEDTIKVVEELTENSPLVIVGSSMGGWLSVLAAERLKERVHGLILLSPAMNYVYPYYQRHIKTLPTDIQHRIETGDIHIVDGKFGDALLKRDFAEDSLQYHLTLEKDSININCPVRIIHGLMDEEVNPEDSKKLCSAIQSEDVDLIYRKNSTHEMERAPLIWN
ncbi:ABHD10 [Lepeophtheirus salmonis]|uniref:ABHD10 n=1 Tax=Lepeophtheirus salmonis TaxID=72036 RepID=A0A7R8CR58_LEPSM|nr:ABHD10 [Lepeophtheirus salmonis]CAF2902101.1 ABHD10 [Lepeophtheirus salmonis]